MDAILSTLQELEHAKHVAYGLYLDVHERIAQYTRQIHNTTSYSEEPDPRQVDELALSISLPAEVSIRTSSLNVVRLIMALTEEQQVQLVRASNEVYERYIRGDLSMLDELSLRTEAFDYIIDPSARVLQAHEQHLLFLRRCPEQN